ncbi:hypothetical protein A2738_00885 [Candidatus Nomurabacteria bacterium RIFCSPHIGHO2_01_FULL_42_15]|uniref:Metal-dependent hydrolase n=1 Tax=Candidatus Nomurabacteria bacterium RIFCSPHIGHO2_01_FULL_42_15 TaxID=1801742 RepID=A0A1F6VFS2_9BACT|nr:MAG: hypothetical protein A2738_00885 [Candidatus Nomurabacteria bacterium RIFCSPHIGHO2_01_FULL_42_15]OGI93150.1 MAG: hypothetical protein A3A99_01285 [Candidatus Nomurabacteria bacterium RIFCSPLOWO2_01_FULL_41_18]
MPIENSQFSWYWLAGSIIPDIDHIFVLCKYKLFSWKKLVDAEKFEDKYNIHFKTKYGHSILGATISTLPLLFINPHGALLFFLAYLLHLLLDWLDIDEKQYLFPFSKKKFRGFLPIFSILERIFTAVLFLILIYLYLIL